MEGKPSLLIETVAENIARKVLSNHRMVLGVRVAVRKPHVAIAGMFDSMGRLLSFYEPFPCTAPMIAIRVMIR